MFYWNPKRIKELKDQGYKLKVYEYDPEFQNQTIEELESKKQKEENNENS
jgi:hypothetical protein